MSYNLVAALSFSIGLPALAGLLWLRKVDPAYYPFIFSLWLGFINELLSFLLIRSGHPNAINSNIYVLAESLLLFWFFKKQGGRPRAIYTVITLLCLAWVWEKFFFSSIKVFSSYFNVFYSFLIVLFSINLVNHALIAERKAIFRNSAFLLAVLFILFYTCSILVEIFWIYGLNASQDFRIQVYNIMTFVNLFVNLSYILAILWMPAKREYILPSSSR